MDTIERLRAAGYDGSQLFFITGADAFAEIATWKGYPTFLERAHFVVVSRAELAVEALRTRLSDLTPRMLDLEPSRKPVPELPIAHLTTKSIFLLNVATPDVSSTKVRRLAAASASLAELVPSSVEQHIRQHRLYLPPEAAATGLHDQA
jgi:nicotinate-nucleotide adenylyltransferase